MDRKKILVGRCKVKGRKESAEICTVSGSEADRHASITRGKTGRRGCNIFFISVFCKVI